MWIAFCKGGDGVHRYLGEFEEDTPIREFHKIANNRGYPIVLQSTGRFRKEITIRPIKAKRNVKFP